MTMMYRYNYLCTTIIIGSFVKMLAVVTFIWEFHPDTLKMMNVFVMTSQIVALQGTAVHLMSMITISILGCSVVQGGCTVSSGIFREIFLLIDSTGTYWCVEHAHLRSVTYSCTCILSNI